MKKSSSLNFMTEVRAHFPASRHKSCRLVNLTSAVDVPDLCYGRDNCGICVLLLTLPE